MFHDNLFFSLLFLVFAVSAATQLYYYLWFYMAVARYKHPPLTASGKPVSIIICARDEAENLRDFLPSVLEQDYPDYEVIVVNDCSEDETEEVLADFSEKYSRLKVSTIKKDQKFAHNKKFAQFIGIKASKNEILLFTDADCRPESPAWISGMAQHFTDRIDFVLGYGGYQRKKGFLNSFIRYETLFIAMQYLGMAIRGIPYMGVGRNLAYRRAIFFDNKGFASHSHVISGDDDLFVNSNSRGENTKVEFRGEMHTRSVPVSTFHGWVNQKKRHLTTAPYYKTRDKFLLLTEPVSRIIYYVTFAVLLSWLFLWPALAAIFIFRMAIQITITLLAQKRLNEAGLAGYSLIFDIFSPVINGIILFSNTIRRPGKNQWK